jgi:hypothetical protein
VEDRSAALLRLLNRPNRAPREPRRSSRGVLLAIALVCSASEALLRIAPSLLLPQHRIELQAERSARPSVPDPELGLRSAPGLHQMVYTPEFEYLLESDAQGFPNRVRPARADVVVLGGTAVTGEGVGSDGQFSGLLGQAFPELGVLNLGLPSAGPEQQYRTWREHAQALAPRVVISVVCVASDAEDAQHFADWLAEGGRRDYAAFRAERSTAGGGLAHVLRQSYLLRSAVHGFERVARSAQFTEQVELASGESLLLSLPRQRRLAQALPPALVDALAAPLERLAGEARAAGAVFVVVLLPSKEELHGAAREPALLGSVDTLRGRLGALPVLDLYTPLAEEAPKAALFFGADPHLNALGNRLVAGALGAWLRSSGAGGEAQAPPPS